MDAKDSMKPYEGERKGRGRKCEQKYEVKNKHLQVWV
jgi:hypothetical protein